MWWWQQQQKSTLKSLQTGPSHVLLPIRPQRLSVNTPRSRLQHTNLPVIIDTRLAERFESYENSDCLQHPQPWSQWAATYRPSIRRCSRTWPLCYLPSARSSPPGSSYSKCRARRTPRRMLSSRSWPSVCLPPCSLASACCSCCYRSGSTSSLTANWLHFMYNTSVTVNLWVCGRLKPISVWTTIPEVTNKTMDFECEHGILI